jgi:hypothetical protein
MIVVQNMLVPYLIGDGQKSLFSGISGGTAIGKSSQGGGLVMSVDIKFDSLRNFVVSITRWFSSMRGIFLMLSLIQGLFAGVIIGKMAEGDIISGLKHSIILMTISFFVMTLFKVG